ncbi:Dam family site-specific DNA-(adenine-N6)-methyltransferase, partial [candidate division TA06 bacterium]
MGRPGKHIETVQSTLLHPTEKQRKSSLSPGPFVKWAGGKGQLLRQYESLFPSTFKSYIEPFVGGGAVFFHLFRADKLKKKNVTLIDSNEELVNCYTAVKDDPEKLIRMLCDSKYKNEEKAYYEIRGERPRERFRRAARTIYLNKTCFNGLYRVNRKGQFNVPFGAYKNPLICDSANLKAVSAALQNVEIVCGDFGNCLEFAKKGDFIYFDPPYQPLSKTSSFT